MTPTSIGTALGPYNTLEHRPIDRGANSHHPVLKPKEKQVGNIIITTATKRSTLVEPQGIVQGPHVHTALLSAAGPAEVQLLLGTPSTTPGTSVVGHGIAREDRWRASTRPS